ncbi:3-hydroxybutyryl-CoA dehydrogenase [Kineosporia mesophila]|uniref:3-hydroxybutyryl-CoA dehydrogenase n=1 Tax=Kineosporia mesophila TaxID=566012 RepID=A0ABP6ZWA8_9ACTN|nr:3-hydroxybutyryl-CoA dehydrogenase [Kineosporia mesophila]MCD5348591.1 3-hydroxyacyl-CoA dehydrogenase NAD-binding domain-containing protein [Kineosporia mesophila]
MARQIRTVGVIGLGTMGSGIAEVLARHGFGVIGVEIDAVAVGRARARIEASTARAVERGKLPPADRAELLARIEFSTEVARVAGAGLVIEAVPEVLGRKREILAALDAVVAPDAILATNTSSLPVTEIAVATGNPRRVIGLHFFNPAPVQELVEVVRTVVSDEDVVDDAALLVRALGKEPVVVGDQAGFIANALLFGYLNHAVSMFEAKYARREDIDDAMRLGCGLPMGPLALMDLIGLDTAYEILDSMYRQTRDRLHAPAPLIKQMVSAGLTGRKTGRGFYRYAAPGSSVVLEDALPPAGGPVADRGRDVQVVGVVGSGTMATGIVEVLAKAGLDVLFVARTPQRAEAVHAGLRRSLDRSVSKGRLTAQQRDAALGKVRGTTALADLRESDLVLEAVVEDLEVKQALFRDLDRICRPGAVLATTTSSLPVIECAAVTERPQDVIGIHFFNPAPAMRLVEVISTISTAEDVTLTALKLCRRIRQHPVTCGDRAGFIVNALLFPYLNDAVKMLGAHYAQAPDIDRAMRLGCGYPMGPFELLDVVGLDVSLAIERVLFHEFREPGFAPSPMLEHLVTAGYLGRKTGRGFRTYG